jgi:tRNA threonylcarbamoyladenosine biosynthesis protein TsaE
MSTEQIWEINSTSLKNTLEIGESLGRHLRGGEVIELVSDLGGGKTAFVKGLAKGMGSTDNVHSPSFTLSNQYKAGELILYHFDFYRLDDPGILRNELAEILEDVKAVVAVEWPDIASNVIPSSHLTVNIRATGIDTRNIKISYPEELKYLINENA